MPGLLGVGGVVDLGRVAVPLGPAQVHPHQHLGEVGGVDAAGLGADGDQRLARVVLPGEQGADLELVQRPAQRAQLALGLGEGSAASAGSSSPSASSTSTSRSSTRRRHPLHPVHLRLHVGQPAGHLLGVLLVVPQVRGSRLLGQLGDLRPQRGQVADLEDRAESLANLAQLGGEIDGHVGPAYACRPPSPDAGPAARRRLLGRPPAEVDEDGGTWRPARTAARPAAGPGCGAGCRPGGLRTRRDRARRTHHRLRSPGSCPRRRPVRQRAAHCADAGRVRDGCCAGRNHRRRPNRAWRGRWRGW